MAKIIVGMSGGVDSAAAAYLLKKEGHEVTGVTLRTWDSGGSRCCEIDEARRTAKFLGIPYHVISCMPDFRRKVEEPFIEGYRNGTTPNPCVLCNPEVKWEWMLYAAKLHGADAVATGHYTSSVKMPNGRYTVRQAADRKKDQSYMLYRLTQEQLKMTEFPLGNFTKQEVRHIAERAGLPSAKNGDSQEICFVTRGTYADFIRDHCRSGTGECGTAPGNFIDESGRELGQHRGIIYYTVGQHRKLGLALGYPVYVKKILPDTNEIMVARENALRRGEIFCGDMHFLSVDGIDNGENMRAKVKVRYHHEGTWAEIAGMADGKIRIMFDEPVRAPAPGQSAVFYDAEGCVIGGGVILQDQ